MSDATIYVSVIIATYNSGAGIQRVFDSLDSQTLPRENFEVVFVDDGSTDDTYTTVQEYAALHPNVKFARIENSGWPSKPRNVAVGLAEGEYLMFMDHDDTLYRDALRSAAMFGREHDSDIVIPKEMKSNDSWWCIDALIDGNVASVPKDSGFFRMLPMVPHKLYRRKMYVENGIEFPERRRALWEDQFINVAAFRHAKTVSILADSPFYLWHASDTNTSHTFDPKNEDFWDRLRDIMAFMDQQFAAPELRNARTTALALQVQVRVIDRLVRLLMIAPEETKEMAFGNAQRLLEQYLDSDIYDVLPWRHKVLSHLLRAGRADLMEKFQEFDLALTFTNSVHDVSWQADGLHGTLTSVLASNTRPVAIKQVDDSIVWNLPDELVSLLPEDLLDFEKQLTVRLEVSLKNRASKISWFPSTYDVQHRLEAAEDGSVMVVASCKFTIKQKDWDNSAGEGAGIWDFQSRSTFSGMIRNRPPVYSGKPSTALFGASAVTSYENKKHQLTIDADQSQRSVVIDHAASPARGHLEGIELSLDGVETFVPTDVDAALYLLPVSEQSDDSSEISIDPAQFVSTGLRVMSSTDGPVARGSLALAPGVYSIYALRSGGYVKTSKSMLVKATGHFTIYPSSQVQAHANVLFA